MNSLSMNAADAASVDAPAAAEVLDRGADLNRRERKKRETRDALEAAALRLFAEKGYDETTVEEIAEAADVAVRTFFRYFQSKQHVLFGDVAHDVTGRLRSALDVQPTTLAPVLAVGAALELLGLDSDDERRQILDRMRLLEKLPELSGTYHMIFQDLHDVIAAYTAERIGALSRDLYPQLLASAATGSIKAALLVFENAPDGAAIGDLRAEAYELMTAGLHDVVRAVGPTPPGS
jgi:AcrR family transcriptional regulator